MDVLKDSKSVSRAFTTRTTVNFINKIKLTHAICVSFLLLQGGFMKNSSYKTIAVKNEASFIEKKSEFIGYLCPVVTDEQATNFIGEIKAMHRKARHNCYCYILRDNNIVRYSDDGEPAGTAGIPIFEALKKAELVDVCCVVTRYFGGILLGGGGLVRAYTKATAMAIETAKIKQMAIAVLANIKVNYSLYGKMAAIFSAFEVSMVEENFTEEVEINLYVKEELFETLKASLIEACFGQVVIQNIQKEFCDFA